MRYNLLGRTGEKVSALGCGTMWFARMTQAETDLALNHALDMGVTYFDCARSYGDAEIKVGKAIGHRRDQFFMATKAAGRDRKTAARQIDESLKRLGTDRIDLIQLHYVNHQSELDEAVGPGGAMEAAQRAREAGKVGHIGITGHRPEKLADWLSTGLFETVLFHLSPVQPFAARDLLPAAKTLGVGTMAMRPVGSGLLADARGALRYVASQRVDVIVSGLTSPEIVDENIRTLEEPVADDEAARLVEWVGELGSNDCRRCNYCTCPVGIEIPDAMISEPVARRGRLSDAGRKTWEKAIEAVGKCYGHTPCQTQPICESKCPYDLRIRQLMLKVAGAAPARA